MANKRSSKGRKPGMVYQKFCVFCGTKFLATARAAKYCPHCKELYEQDLRNERSNRAHHIKRGQTDNITLIRYLREIDAYNEENKTSFTYGQYTLLKTEGKIL